MNMFSYFYCLCAGYMGLTLTIKRGVPHCGRCGRIVREWFCHVEEIRKELEKIEVFRK